MRKKLVPPLQPLRIANGWKVEWNHFREIDPKFRSWDDTSWYFTEGMLYITSDAHGVAIDLSWRREARSTGCFILQAVRYPDDEWDPFRELRTRSRRKAVATIESWLAWYSEHRPPPRRRGRRRGGRS